MLSHKSALFTNTRFPRLMSKGVWMASISDGVALHHRGVLCAPPHTTWLASALAGAYLSDPNCLVKGENGRVLTHLYCPNRTLANASDTTPGVLASSHRSTLAARGGSFNLKFLSWAPLISRGNGQLSTPTHKRRENLNERMHASRSDPGRETAYPGL